MRDNVQARKNALSASNPSNGPPASAISAQEPMSNSEASMIPRTEPSSADIKQSTDLDAGSIDANGPNKIDDPVEATDPGIRNGESSDARTAGSEDTNSDASDFKDVIAGILLGLNDASADQTPWLHVESYDIKQFAAPPDPSGFFAELKELDRIKSDYVERQHRRLEEVRRQDAEYMASLEASGKALSGPSRARKFRATVKEATERHFAKTVGFFAYTNHCAACRRRVFSAAPRDRGYRRPDWEAEDADPFAPQVVLAQGRAVDVVERPCRCRHCFAEVGLRCVVAGRLM